MDFFKSVFSNDPETSSPEPPQKSMSNRWKNPSEKLQEESEQPQHHQEQEENQELSDGFINNPNMNNTQLHIPSANAWNFGGLIKTLTSKSEEVLQTYRRDLEEFSSGLKKETAAIREVASRAVKDLPGSLEAGASVAQESLESVGQVIDDFGSSVWRGTSEVLSQGKDVLANADQYDNSDVGAIQNSGFSSLNSSSRRYSSRFEAMVYNLQVDLNTYCQEPEDLDDYSRWKSGFVLEEKGEEIEGICKENGAVEGMISKVVPRVVDYETFWGRYFYKVHKLKQAEDVRANLVKRVIEREEEEDLSWEVDDEEIECGVAKNGFVGNDAQKNEKEMGEDTENKIALHMNAGMMEGDQKNAMQFEMRDVTEVNSEKKSEILEMGEDNSDCKNSARDMVEKENADKGIVEISGGHAGSSDEKIIWEGKNDIAESSKDSDFSVVSSQRSHEEDDLGWDEIEDLGSIDEKKATNGSPVKVEDLRKRLNAADDDEDLSWDIEDDDPVKP